MSKETSLCSLVYQFLALRIRIGYYQPGDQIYIKPICDLFNISNITVRNALKLLKENHYISLTKNQRATVTWDPTDPEPQPDDFFVDRETLVDLQRSYSLLIAALLKQGLPLFHQNGLDEMVRISNRTHLVFNQPIVYFIKHILAQYGNPLLSALNRDILLYSYPTTAQYLEENPVFRQSYLTQLQQSFQQVSALCLKQDREELDQMIQDLCQVFLQMPDFVEGAAAIPALSQPYQWGKESIGFAVSSALVQQIHSGVYPFHTFLPPIEELAEQFSVSTMTIRRAFRLLNDLGIAETINGSGTKAVPPELGSKYIKWDDPEVQKNLLLFLQSLQIILSTCRCVTEMTFPLLSAEERMDMAEELEAGLSLGLPHIAFGIWSSRMIRYTRWAGIREIYQRLINLLPWGIPLRFSDGYRRFPEETQGMIDSLRQADGDKFMDMLERNCFLTYYYSREILLRLGVEGTEALTIPLLDRYHGLLDNDAGPAEN